MVERKTNRKSNIILVSILVIVSCIGFYRSCTVQKEGVFTIATIYNIEPAARSGLIFDFKYMFYGKEYKSRAGASYDDLSMKDEGKRVFIQVLPNDPSRCFMTDIQVPDSITEAPSEGWEKLPITVIL